jgi:hypothetical protein
VLFCYQDRWMDSRTSSSPNQETCNRTSLCMCCLNSFYCLHVCVRYSLEPLNTTMLDCLFFFFEIKIVLYELSYDLPSGLEYVHQVQVRGTSSSSQNAVSNNVTSLNTAHQILQILRSRVSSVNYMAHRSYKPDR